VAIRSWSLALMVSFDIPADIPADRLTGWKPLSTRQINSTSTLDRGMMKTGECA
jgi:hypothetical protein